MGCVRYYIVQAEDSIRDPLWSCGLGNVNKRQVSHDRDGNPARALVCMLTTSGSRVWGGATDPATLDAMVVEEFVGREAELDPDGAVSV